MADYPSRRVHRAELRLICEALMTEHAKIPLVGGPDYNRQMNRANRIRHLALKLDCDKWKDFPVEEPPLDENWGKPREFVSKKPLTDIEGLPTAEKK